MSPDDRSTIVMRTLGFIVATTLLVSGCSIKRIAINKLGNSLAESGTTYAADDDPELVGAAIPFSLKLIEGLLSASPKHRGLLFAAASGFTQYGYAYLMPPVGENLFLASLRFNKPVAYVFRSVIPMMLVFLIAVLLITYIPALTLTLPNLFSRGGAP